MSNKILKTFCAAWLGLSVTACDTTEQQQVGADDVMSLSDKKDGTDIQQALTALGSARVVATHDDGVPYFINGNLGRAEGSVRGLAPVDAKARVQAALASIAPVFRARAEDLVFKRSTVDQNGHEHLRFAQLKDGIPVLGGELILHVDREGNIYSANGSASDTQGNAFAQARISSEAAALAARNATDALIRDAKAERLIYVRDNNRLVLAHEVRVQGESADGLPVHDLVYVKASDGSFLLRDPQIHTAKNRKVYSANNTSSTPGTLKRSEGQAAIGDAHVDMNYDMLGLTYDCYSTLFGRDSFDNAGATLISTVHYGSRYVNAYWDGTQMVYGDGDGTNSIELGKDLDVTVHELSHAVTDRESDLVYSGESGGLNESYSDIFGAVCESWTRNWSTDADVWKVGEDIWTPNTAGDALRYMDDPKKDGVSLEHYADYAGQDVHYSSGISNLAFKLLSTGGTHPRGRSTVVVPAIGVEKAARIWYKANVDIWGANTTFAQAKTGTEQAASQLGYDAATIDAVSKAWQAVGVGIVLPPPPTTTLTNDVPVTGIGGSTNDKKYYKLTVPAGQSSLVFTTTGGTGDVDLYTQFGAAPTASSYACRPYAGGNAETCTHTNPAAGDWYVMLNAYSTYSGVTLKGTYTGTTPPGDTLTNGVATAPYSGAKGSWKCWTLTVPAGKASVAFAQAGGSGDADLYVRLGAAPTTSTYTCRAQGSSNNDSCSVPNPAAGTYHACSYGYAAYSNTTMKGTY